MKTKESNTLTEYFEALDRLILGQPKLVPKESKITNDSVSLEAGRTKGSIKKSRPSFAPLIEAIASAASTQRPPDNDLLRRLAAAEHTRNQFRRLYEETIARELSLLNEVYSLKKELSRLTGQNILPLRRERGG